MENIIGLKELREHMDKYASQVQKGKSFIVMRRSRPIFKVSPPSEDSGEWERVIDFTKIKKGGISVQDLIGRL